MNESEAELLDLFCYLQKGKVRIKEIRRADPDLVKRHELPPYGMILGPKDGWKNRTVYRVLMSMRPSNPCFEALFYTGFCNERSDGQGWGPAGGKDGGWPGGYAKAWIPGQDVIDFREIHYMRPLQELYTQE